MIIIWITNTDINNDKMIFMYNEFECSILIGWKVFRPQEAKSQVINAMHSISIYCLTLHAMIYEKESPVSAICNSQTETLGFVVVLQNSEEKNGL